MSKEELISRVKGYNPLADTTMIELAYDFAESAHAGQVRLNGEPYFSHCLGAVEHLLKMHLDDATIIAGYFTMFPMRHLSRLMRFEKFRDDIATLVDGVGRLGTLKYRGIERYADNLRKLFISMAHDIRIIFVKFADRLHNLETLSVLPAEKQQRIAREVVDIYAPIAHRLGIGYIKTELEDRAFQYVHPQDYEQISLLVAPRQQKKTEYLEAIRDNLLAELQRTGIPVTLVESRVKSFFSIYRKMQKKRISDLEGIYDITAMRVIVPNTQ